MKFIHIIRVLLHGLGQPLDQIHWLLAWRKFKQHATVIESSSMPFQCVGKRGASSFHGLQYYRSSSLRMSPGQCQYHHGSHKKCMEPRQVGSAKLSKDMTSHDHMRSERQGFLAQSAGIVLRRSPPVIRCATRPGLLGIFGYCENGLCTSRRFPVDDDDQGGRP